MQLASAQPELKSRISRFISVVAVLIRWAEWHASKLPFYLVAMTYAVLRMEQPGRTQAPQMVALFALFCCYAAFGHIVNDYADRDADRKAGKTKLIARLSEAQVVIALAIPGIAAIVIASAFLNCPTLALTIVSFLMAAFYSLPPIRLKERGILGWGTAALAQRTLPVAIAFQALGGWDAIAAGLAALSTLIGLRFIIIHQLGDRENDQRTGVRTVATEFRPERLIAVLRGLFVLEIIFACGVVALMSWSQPAVGVAALIYAVALVAARQRGRSVSPQDYFVFYGFYCVIWPITLALLLALRNPLFVPLPCLVVALVQRHARTRFRDVFMSSMAARRQPAGVATALNRRQNPANFEINKADPYPDYGRLRATAPIVKVNWPFLGTNWLVTRHHEALTVFRDSRFIRDTGNLAETGSQNGASRTSARGFGRDMMEHDPPDHTRLRRLVSQTFTPRMIRSLEPRIGQLAHQILDQAKPRGQIELVSEYASVIPIVIISELLGVPVDVENMRALAYALSLREVTDRDNPEAEALKRRFIDNLEAVFAQRQKDPRDDLITTLVQAVQEGTRLSHHEMTSMVFLLLLAGYVTTVNLIGNGVLALLRHPDQLDMLRRNPALAETAIEELLRFDSPVELSSVSFVATGMELGGRMIPAGSPVRVLIPSANRDEAQFVGPDILDITRDPCPHVAFGQGIHHCLGAPLARLEGKITILALLERAPHLSIADPALVQWLPHPILRGLRQLPLRF